MIEYIKGQLTEINPSVAILECYGIGYNVLISLQTYETIKDKKEVKLYIHHYIREDDEAYYGFASKDERELFRLLISVSGIGVSTARIILSSLSAEELRDAILSEDIVRIKSIKGIGVKSAQRMVLELKDKIVKGEGSSVELLSSVDNNSAIEQASSALVLLGFSKPNVNKVVRNIIKENSSAQVEDIIKAALKML